jgi:excisionase family DNA binding protein
MSDELSPTCWITIAEAAELTEYNVRYLRQLVNGGKIHALKRGGIFWIEKASVTTYIDEMKRLGPSKHDPWRAGVRRKNACPGNRTDDC